MEPIPVDFRRSELLPEPIFQALQAIHEAFVRNLSSSLSMYLRTEVTGTFLGVEKSSFGELADRLPSPGCLVFFVARPEEENVLLEINPSLIVPILDCVLGGDGNIEGDTTREITDIEKNMLGDFFRIAGRKLSEAWKAAGPLDLVLDAVETAPLLSKRIGRQESIAVVALELKLGEKTGVLNLGIPAGILRLLVQKSEKAAGRKSGSVQKEMAVKQRLAAGLKLEVECALLGSHIRLRDLLNLKVGDLIDSGIACDGSVTILVNGAAKLRGEVTTDNGRQAVMVLGPLGGS